ncbi:MAG TPA: thiamine pyrophosphate-binding protein [Crenotrichaceae bacterium]|nr:thiamine pyrophosphate-binding protein [Crenotrichaceae bacterium]
MAVNQTQLDKHQHSPELGDLLVHYLEQLGIEYIFGVPGGAIEPFYNALARSERRNGPRSITACHETGAAFMAEGYTRQTGKIGVCCATTGPGTTNLITGVASAYENQIPMLVITAQTALSHFGQGAFQESSCTGINTVAMLDHCTRYSTLISHVEQFEQKLVTAIMTAHHSPHGPVHLSIPLDIMRAYSPVSKPSYNLADLISHGSVFDHTAADQLCKLLKTAKQPVFIIGSDCSEAIGIILQLAVLLQIQIVTTPDGKGFVSPYHPLFRGVTGFAGHDTANDLLSSRDTDLIIAVGTNLGEWATNGWDHQTILNNRLVHIQSAEKSLTRSPMAQLHLQGRISAIFSYTLTEVQKETQPAVQQSHKKILREVNSTGKINTQFRMRNEYKCHDDSSPIKPQRLMHLLAEIFPPQTCFTVDTGNSTAWAIHYLHPFDRRIAGHHENNSGLVCFSQEFSSMGWAIGASIGIAIGNNKRPTVCITGDGSLLMSGQEISVAVQQQLPIIYIVLNDSALGMVKHGQRMGNAEQVAYQLATVDFAAYAQAIGANGIVIKTPEDIQSINVNSILKCKSPTILDVRIDTDEIPPIGCRVHALKDLS